MAATLHNPRAGILTRLAHWLGRMWARGERNAAEALVSVGLTQQAAKAVIWVVKLAILAGLIFVAFWLALLVGFAYLVLAAGTKNQASAAKDDVQLEWLCVDMAKQRTSIFYDPLPFNDYEDSRFEMDD